MRISDWSSDGCSSDLLGSVKAATSPDRRNDQIVAVTVDVTMGMPVPAPTPTPTGMAIWPMEKRPEASATMPPASESTVMILPPEPSRKSVNLLSAVSKVVSAPANAGPANQKEANRRAAITTIANSARPVSFRTDCMLGSLQLEARRKRRPGKADQHAAGSSRAAGVTGGESFADRVPDPTPRADSPRLRGL